MAGVAANITVAGVVRLFIAPSGTALPADESAALNVAFVEVGFTDDAGAKFKAAPQVVKVKSHQSDYPTRTIKTGAEGNVSLTLQEWSKQNFATAFGGGVTTLVSAGHWKYAPPGPTALTLVSAILSVVDGTKVYRFIIPNCRSIDPVEVALTKMSEAGLPVGLDVQGTDGADPWYVLTNDPAFT